MYPAPVFELIQANNTLPLAITKEVAKDLVGPLLIGTFLNITLFGSLLMQSTTYYRHATNDPRWLKILVAALLLVDTLNSTVAAYIGYNYAVNDFGLVDKIQVVGPEFAILTLTTGLSGSIVQGFFGMRVKWLTKQTWLGVAIVAAAALAFLCTVAITAWGIHLRDFRRFHQFNGVVIAWLVISPITDLAISGSLVRHLRKIQTGFSETDDLLSKITRAVIQTGAITVVWAVVDLIIFLTIATNLHFIFNIPLAKLYANCMLSSLNARNEWRSSHTSDPGPGKQAPQWPVSEGPGIKVTTMTDLHRDDIELEHRAAVQRARATIRPEAFVDIKRQHALSVDRAWSRDRQQPDLKSDGLSINSDSLSDLEDPEGRPRKTTDQRVDWRGML